MMHPTTGHKPEKDLDGHVRLAVAIIVRALRDLTYKRYPRDLNQEMAIQRSAQAWLESPLPSLVHSRNQLFSQARISVRLIPEMIRYAKINPRGIENIMVSLFVDARSNAEAKNGCVDTSEVENVA